jgi:hypothetical protein
MVGVVSNRRQAEISRTECLKHVQAQISREFSWRRQRSVQVRLRMSSQLVSLSCVFLLKQICLQLQGIAFDSSAKDSHNRRN